MKHLLLNYRHGKRMKYSMENYTAFPNLETAIAVIIFILKSTCLLLGLHSTHSYCIISILKDRFMKA